MRCFSFYFREILYFSSTMETMIDIRYKNCLWQSSRLYLTALTICLCSVIYKYGVKHTYSTFQKLESQFNQYNFLILQTLPKIESTPFPWISFSIHETIFKLTAPFTHSLPLKTKIRHLWRILYKYVSHMRFIHSTYA